MSTYKLEYLQYKFSLSNKKSHFLGKYMMVGQVDFDHLLVQGQVHINLFITQFVITRFWIQHCSKMDPKNV